MGYYSKKGLLDDIGIVECGHNGIRLFVPRLLKDAEYNRFHYGLCIPKQEILSKDTCLCNALRGNAKLSSFELSRGTLLR